MTDGFLDILLQLHDAGADFVIVGGVAAALRGSLRVTFDLDIVLSLDPGPWRFAVEFLLVFQSPRAGA